MDINKLYKAQKNPTPDLKELYSKINKFKGSKLRKIWFTNLILLFTSIFIAAIGYFIQPKNVSTWLGIGLTISSMAVFVFAYNKMIPLYKSLDKQSSNSDYINTLLAIKKREAYLSRQMMNLYFVMLFTGILLYMIEYVQKMDLTWGIVTYLITILWFLFNWVVLRPKQIKKNEEEINQVINKIEEINTQLC